MGLINEIEPRGEILINPKEQDLISILNSQNPLDELAHFAIPHTFHLMQNELSRLVGQLGNPNEEEQKQARLELTWYCLPTINATVQKYRGLGIPDTDILQSAFLSTQEYIQTWSEEPKVTDETFKAKIGINVNQALVNQVSEMYQIKNKDIDLVVAYFDAREIYLDQVGREVLEKELSELIIIIQSDNFKIFSEETDWNVKRENYKKLRTLSRIHEIYSYQNQGSQLLNSTVSNENLEQIGDNKVLNEEFSDLFESLPAREQRVLKLRYFEGLTLEAIGKNFGVTRDRIRQIEAQALSRLRHPAVRRHLRPYLDNNIRGTIKESLPTVKDIIPSDLKQDEVSTQLTKEPAVEKIVRTTKSVKKTPEIIIQKSELPKDYWLDYHFRRYTQGVATGKESLLKLENHPGRIEPSSVWHEALNSIRTPSLAGECIFAGCDQESSKVRLIIDNLRRNPERMSAREFLHVMNKALKEEGLFGKIGDVQSILRYRMLFTIFGADYVTQIEHEQPSLSPIQLYRFLIDADRPLLTGKTDGPNNIFAMRSSETYNLDPDNKYITQNVFIAHWFSKYDYHEISPNRWVPRRGDQWQGWEITKDIAKNHNLVLYTGRPDKPLSKIKLS